MTQPNRLTGLHRMTRAERLAAVAAAADLTEAERAALDAAAQAQGALADHMSENVISTFNIPLGVATNLLIDGRETIVPMATEESSVVAAVCNAAKRCRATGGVVTSSDAPRMIAQVQLTGLPDPFAARARTLERIDEIRGLCDACDPVLVRLGGGLRDVEARVIDAGEPMLIVHLIVDVRDAMGANAVNTMAERIAPRLAEWTGGTVGLRILSNLADRRLARARAVWRLSDIGVAETRDAMLRAGAFAQADPYRAATHNKGIMNGVSAVALATGNDTRAVEAGAHAYAARTGRYASLTRWERTAQGDLAGSIELPMPVGVVGGATRAHPLARIALKILGADGPGGGERLARVMAAVGLVQNFAAMRALAAEGIQRGHMALHARNVAIAAGATGDRIDEIARKMRDRGEIRSDVAEALLRGSE